LDIIQPGLHPFHHLFVYPFSILGFSFNLYTTSECGFCIIFILLSIALVFKYILMYTILHIVNCFVFQVYVNVYNPTYCILNTCIFLLTMLGCLPFLICIFLLFRFPGGHLISYQTCSLLYQFCVCNGIIYCNIVSVLPPLFL
jgi:hypothetical protein